MAGKGSLGRSCQRPLEPDHLAGFNCRSRESTIDPLKKAGRGLPELASIESFGKVRCRQRVQPSCIVASWVRKAHQAASRYLLYR